MIKQLDVDGEYIVDINDVFNRITEGRVDLGVYLGNQRFFGVLPASRILNVDPSDIKNRIKNQKIPYILVNDRPFISEQEILRNMSENLGDTIKSWVLSGTLREGGKIINHRVYTIDCLTHFVHRCKKLNVFIEHVDVPKKKFELGADRYKFEVLHCDPYVLYSYINMDSERIVYPVVPTSAVTFPLLGKAFSSEGFSRIKKTYLSSCKSDISCVFHENFSIIELQTFNKNGF